VFLDRALKAQGFVTGVYAIYRHKDVENVSKRYEELPTPEKNDIVIYHMNEISEINTDIKNMKCKKIAIYHNTTPPIYFANYHKMLCRLQTEATKQIKTLKDCFDLCIADSEFNKKDLIKMGYDEEKITVIPVYMDFDEYKQAPDDKKVIKYRDEKVNIVFVGRIAPNKKQENIIRAFAHYKRYINNKSRLIIAGTDFDGTYFGKLQSYVETLGLDDVVFTGKVSFPEILAIYITADIFLCMSEHEGFCIPLIEAMMFNVPIIAYNSTVIPETLGGAGVLTQTKDEAHVAGIIDKIITDETYRAEIIEGQKKRLKDFSGEQIFNQILDVVRSVEAL